MLDALTPVLLTCASLLCIVATAVITSLAIWLTSDFIVRRIKR